MLYFLVLLSKWWEKWFSFEEKIPSGGQEELGDRHSRRTSRLAYSGCGWWRHVRTSPRGVRSGLPKPTTDDATCGFLMYKKNPGSHRPLRLPAWSHVPDTLTQRRANVFCGGRGSEWGRLRPSYGVCLTCLTDWGRGSSDRRHGDKSARPCSHKTQFTETAPQFTFARSAPRGPLERSCHVGLLLWWPRLRSLWWSPYLPTGNTCLGNNSNKDTNKRLSDASSSSLEMPRGEKDQQNALNDFF